MIKKRKQHSTYTVMFIPDDNGKTFSLRVNKTLVTSFVVFIVLFLLGMTALIIKAGEVGMKLQLVEALKNENHRLRQDNRKIEVIADKLERMRDYGLYLERLATSIGQDAQGTHLVRPSDRGQDDLLQDDSLDGFLDVVRMASSQDYRDVSVNGTTPQELADATPNIRPVEGWVTNRFSKGGASGQGKHLGLDFAAPEGTLIRSAAPGVVDDVLYDKYFGRMVVVKHSYGFETRYGHCSQILVSEGDPVQRGQAVALVGNTGRSSGPHLHFEVLKNGEHVDPMQYIVNRSNGR